MKKILAAILSIAMIVSLAACGSSSQPSAPAASGDSKTEAAAPAATEAKSEAAPAAPAAEEAKSEAPAESAPDSSGSAATADADKYGGVLRFVCTAEGANTIGLPWEVFGVDTALLIPCGESLLRERTDGTYANLLAEDVEVLPEDLTIKIKLREGVKFHDGTDFNADAAIWNMEHQLEAATLATAITGFEKTGDYTFDVKLEKYSNNILTSFASRANSMISPTAYNDNGEDWARENVVGTGPFVMTEYVQGSHISFVRNENYWQEGRPYLDAMEVLFMKDVMTQNVAMQSTGDQSINVLNTTNGEQIQMLRDMGFEVASMPIGPISLVPNSLDEDSPFAKYEVRLAVSYALDRQAICDARGFGILQPAYQFIGEQWPQTHLDDSYNLSYDLDKAKELMKEAGYENGFSTTLYAQPSLADTDAVVAIQGMLAEIGINASIETPDSGGYSAYRANGWDGLLVQHTRTLTVNSSTFNFYFGSTSKLLSRLWWPDNMEELVQAGFAKDDNSEELKTLHKTVLENMLVIPVYYLFDSWVYDPSIKDGEFAQWGSATMFLPDQVYIEK